MSNPGGTTVEAIDLLRTFLEQMVALLVKIEENTRPKK